MKKTVLLLLLASLGGCAYLRDRAADAADVLTLEVGVGYGLTADVKASDYLHLGFGYAHLWTRGVRGRDLVPPVGPRGGAPGLGAAPHRRLA